MKRRRYGMRFVSVTVVVTVAVATDTTSGTIRGLAIGTRSALRETTSWGIGFTRSSSRDSRMSIRN